MSDKTTVDYLDEDPPIANQKFFCISFLKDKEDKSKIFGVKFRGSYATYEKTCERAKQVQQMDPYFHVFVGETGKWLPFDPSPDSELVEDEHYANKELNALMKGHKENQEKAKIYHEQRKNEKISKNISENKNKNKNKIELKEDNNQNSEDILRQLNEKIRELENEEKKINV